MILKSKIMEKGGLSRKSCMISHVESQKAKLIEVESRREATLWAEMG